MRALLLVLLATALDAGMAPPSPEPAQAAADDAADAGASAGTLQPLVEKVVACLVQEGAAVTDADRKLLQSAAAELDRELARADVCAGLDGGCPALDFRSLDCAAFAAALRLAPARAEPPSWARAWADALTARVRTCLGQESGKPADAEQTRLLADLTTVAAETLALVSAAGACTVDQTALSRCTAAIGTVSCAALSLYASADESRVAEGLLALCPGVLACGAQAGAR